jgi:hypothetical protein
VEVKEVPVPDPKGKKKGIALALEPKKKAVFVDQSGVQGRMSASPIAEAWKA